MDVLMLEGWTPILLIGIVVAAIIFLASRKIARKTLLLISSLLSLVCIGIVMYSIVVIGGWDGMGIGFVTITAFLGVWIGTAAGVFFKK